MSEETSIPDAMIAEPVPMPPTSTPLVDAPAAPEAISEEAAAPADDNWKNDPEKVSAAIKKANDEAAGHRVKAKPYTEAFGGYSQQEQDYLLHPPGASSGMTGVPHH